MELVDFLAAKGKHQELLSELLPLQEEAGKDPATERHLGRLFLAAGAPSRAAEEYRAIVKQDGKDAAAYAGLGAAELQVGDYRAAHRAFLTAANYKPGDASIQQQLQLSSTLAALDPTSRRLTSMEKYRRSLRILDFARADLKGCIASHPASASDETRETLALANEALTNKPQTEVTNEIAEDVLSIAENAWQVRSKICGEATSPDGQALRLIMIKLAQ